MLIMCMVIMMIRILFKVILDFNWIRFLTVILKVTPGVAAALPNPEQNSASIRL